MRLKNLLTILIIKIIFIGCASLAFPSNAQGKQENFSCNQFSCSLWSLPTNSTLGFGELFNPPKDNWLSGHRGLDLLVNKDETIFAPRDGIIVFSGIVVDRHVVSIEHPEGLKSTFEPVTSTLKPGDSITKGMAIGFFSKDEPNHCHPDSCIHWGVLNGKKSYIDPFSLLRNKPRSVLLPTN